MATQTDTQQDVTITVPAPLAAAIATALDIAVETVGGDLRDYGQKSCMDCGVDDDGEGNSLPCEAHEDDHDLVEQMAAAAAVLAAATA